ncbi:GNAT family N-acetyltransferase [Trueperella bialowiezensis]|uniref:Predicted acetyltransferase involved in intracellular survival and related acetyltransferases n=1 Tax=Trueperella bialowiezensis TaxID=312285 RepID=A0A448PC17_9ACTO|nr:GNAT family N-acetyltransferase [Trueperella bialowiezensis]VEI12515.1 Predicted acetyltransferase involved in intracellular survival and related acetyltransferases [Trueperella bialowiezensis]
MSVSPWQWQPLTASDAPEILDLISRIEDSDNAPIRTTRGEVESYFHASHEWRAQGAWVDGELVAFGLARMPLSVLAMPITISGGVAPQWRARGLGKDLLDRQLHAARRLADIAGTDEAAVHMYAESSQSGLLELAQSIGFEHHSQFIQMRRSLDEPLTNSAESTYVQIVKLTEEWMKPARKTHNRVFSQSAPPTWTKLNTEAWNARMETMERDWCLVALDTFGDRPRLAGYLLASRFSSDISTDGPLDDEGYVEEIVVAPQWRGMNIARTLIYSAIERFRAAGLSYIGLDVNVDAENSDLVTLFEHFGFSQISKTYILATTV